MRQQQCALGLLVAAMAVACGDDDSTADDGAGSTTGGDSTTATTGGSTSAGTTTGTTGTTTSGSSEDTGMMTTGTTASGSSGETGMMTTGSVCGDGVRDADEVCDDGNAVEDDMCTSACEGWRQRIPVDIQATAAATDRTVLVTLTAANFDYATVAADGADLRFGSDMDPVVGPELPYWIEGWDPAGTSRVWVSVPSIAVGTTTVWMFTDFSGAMAPARTDFAAAFPNRFESTGADTLTGTVSVDAFVVDAAHTVTISATSPLVIDAQYVRIDGTIDADGAGFPGGNPDTPGFGPGGGIPTGNTGSGGGGYGGEGGGGAFSPGTGGMAYGDLTTEAIQMGSGGGGAAGQAGASGGGAVTVEGVRVLVSGAINARGADGDPTCIAGLCPGGGAGGGIMLRAIALSFSGTLSAVGGAGGDGMPGTFGGGGGGGGRLKLFGGTVDAAGVTEVSGGVGGAQIFGGADGLDGTTWIDTQVSLQRPATTVGAAEPV